MAIAAVCKESRLALMSDGSILPVATWHSEDGRETNDIDEAVAVTVDLDDGSYSIALLDDTSLEAAHWVRKHAPDRLTRIVH